MFLIRENISFLSYQQTDFIVSNFKDSSGPATKEYEIVPGYASASRQTLNSEYRNLNEI